MTVAGAKVAICIPYYRSVEGPTLLACMAMTACSAMHGVSMLPIGTSGCYIEDNRNGSVQHALDTELDFDWLLWIDGDMIFPEDALVRLIEHDKDIVGANYRQRTPPFAFVGAYLDGKDTHLMEPGLWPMSHLPTGLLLTRFDIYRKLAYPWFNAGLRGQPRDDVYFCNYAREAGYEIWCDHDLTKLVKHITVQDLGWFTPEQLVPVTGAQINLLRHQEDSKRRAALSAELAFPQNTAGATGPGPVRNGEINPGVEGVAK